MLSTEEAGVSWDFAPVFDLIHSLSANAGTEGDGIGSLPEVIAIEPTYPLQQRSTKSDLGNFDKLWTFLGQPLDLDPPQVPPPLVNGFSHHDTDEDALVLQAFGKGVRWRDETEGGELADNEQADNNCSLSGLTKSQRKKFRRRQRKAAGGEKPPQRGSLLATSSSENDSDSGPRTPKRPPADRKAIIQQILYGIVETPNGKPLSATLNGTPRTPLPIDISGWPVATPQRTISSAQHTDRATLIVDAAAKKERLIRKVRERFISDRAFLPPNLSPSPSTNHSNDGIHIFVDASNILIGFHDCLKLSRGLHIHSRFRRHPFSFHNLSLVLERGRPVAKRVLVGSDNYPAIQEAKLIGYETNILDRVHKAKELTPRQKKFLSPNKNSSNNNNTASGSGGGGGGINGGGSGSETTVMYAKEAWVEQAVDEILHLKILESVVDATSPSTMVLATGDAAEAEYSSGFLRMVERALEKGWKVELVSFRKNTSNMYKRREWRGRWGAKFEIVELDDFVEEFVGVD
ncbi:MAG: hypothetical protein Q9220_002035 [cf. Caloplaca sp. 1 TL-2023]